LKIFIGYSIRELISLSSTIRDGSVTGSFLSEELSTFVDQVFSESVFLFVQAQNRRAIHISTNVLYIFLM